MKKKLIYAIFAMVVATVAMVSCKKETQDNLFGNNNQSTKTFSPPKVDDMNAYLSDFKRRMKESPNTREVEFLSLEEAAWHLSSVANYDFANAGRPFDDLRYDTLYSTVTITNGSILMSDLAATYQDVGTEIDKFYNSLSLNEKHIHFINAFISNNGTVAIPIMTTFVRNSRYLGDTLWYYNGIFDFWLDYYSLFDDLPVLPAMTTGRERLERFLNWKENRLKYNDYPYYYTITSFDSLYYRNEIDPFGSPNYMNSRLFANECYMNTDISPFFDYLCDSFLGLGHEHCPSGLYIIQWAVKYWQESPFIQLEEKFKKEHYSLTVYYGQRHEHTPSPGGGGSK